MSFNAKVFHRQCQTFNATLEMLANFVLSLGVGIPHKRQVALYHVRCVLRQVNPCSTFPG